MKTESIIAGVLTAAALETGAATSLATAAVPAMPPAVDGIPIPAAPAAAPAGSPWTVFPILASDRVSRIAFQEPDPGHGGRQSALVIRFTSRGQTQRRQNLDTGWTNPFPDFVFGHDLPARTTWAPWNLRGLNGDRVLAQRPEVSQLQTLQNQPPNFGLLPVLSLVGPGAVRAPAYLFTRNEAVQAGQRVGAVCTGWWFTPMATATDDGSSETGCGFQASQGLSVGSRGGPLTPGTKQGFGAAGRYWFIGSSVRDLTGLDPPRRVASLFFRGRRIVNGRMSTGVRRFSNFTPSRPPSALRGVRPLVWDVDASYDFERHDRWTTWGFRTRTVRGRSTAVEVRARTGPRAAKRQSLLVDPCARTATAACASPRIPDDAGDPALPSALGYGKNGVFVAGNRRITVWDKRTGTRWTRTVPWEARRQRTIFVTPPVATTTRIALVSMSLKNRTRQPRLRLLAWPTEQQHRGWKRVR